MYGNQEHTLWTEMFRPSTLDGYVGNELVISKVRLYLKSGDVPHLLFYGGAGTGKTTLAKIIANNVDADVMYINASDENNIDTVRTKVKSFASTVGFKRWKIVILDECLERGTLVTILRNGEEVKIPIEDLDENNDLVKSFNIKTNEIEWQPFYLWEKGDQEIWEIELENGELVKCTEDHKWHVYDTDNNVKVVKTKELDQYMHILSPK
ncbi:MAG: AAA family ATPase [Pelagibacterales bacterium]|nr:AAA family ATPase [Pelagibacterales bacterium]